MPARKAGQGVSRKDRKCKFMDRLNKYLNDFKNILIVKIDNVGSNQVQRIRLALRGKANVLMGKNTIIRKVLRERMAENPHYETLLPLIFGNIGFVFTNANLSEVRNIVVNFKTPAAAKVGTIANNNVLVPAGPTGLDPGQTSFFQALNIATKIVKGSIEIINEVTLLKPGDKVSASHVALLDKLNIKPFHYGMVVTDVYEDGVVYSATVLDMSQDVLMEKFLSGVKKIAALSLALGYPTHASLPYLVAGAFAKLLAISLVTEVDFEQAQKYKEMLKNPGAFAAAAAPAAAASSSSSAAPAAAAAAAEPEEEEDFGGFNMFD